MLRSTITLAALIGITSISHAEAEKFFSEKVHNFGSTPRGPQLVHYFNFTNTSKETLVISNVRVSCGCVTASAPVRQIKPGESSYIHASMDSRRFSGPKAVTVYVQFSAPIYEEISLLVQANGRDDFSMYPETLSFGGIRKGTTPVAKVQVTLYSDPNWSIESVKADSNYVKPQARLIKRNGAEVTYEISASLRADLPVGKWFSDIWLQTNNDSLARVRVPLTVDVNSAITATPENVQLGEVKVGDSTEQNVMIRGDKPFTIKEIRGLDDSFKAQETNNAPKAVHVLKISFKPDRVGNVHHDLTIVTDHSDEPMLLIPLTATGTSD